MTVQPPPRPQNWIERNWKWAAPVGCLAILGVMAGFAVVIVSLIVGGMRSSDAYKTGIAHAIGNPAVDQALGAPVKPGWFTSGSIQLNNDRGTADIRIPLEGTRGEGTLRVVGEKAAGKWFYSTIELVPEGGGATIDLRRDKEKGASF